MVCCEHSRATAVTRARELNMFFEDGQRPMKSSEMHILVVFHMLRAAEERSDGVKRTRRVTRVKRICFVKQEIK